MNFELLFNDSISYTRETFTGHWDRWLILALLGLPFSLIRFVFVPVKIITPTGFHWEQIPWGSIAALVIAGILASFFIAGYTVRIYRGTRPAPGLTDWASLFIDGIKVDIVMLGWLLPALVVLLAELAMGIGMLSTAGYGGGTGFLIPMILLIPVEIILVLVAILFIIPGAVRFARTGSMAEGWGFSALLGIVRRIGWGRYLIALILFVIASVLYSIAVSLPAVIPYVGWIVPVALAPLFTVFSARYFTVVYEAGEEPRGAAPAGQPGP